MSDFVQKLRKLSELLKAGLTPSLRMPGNVAPKAPKVPSLAPPSKKSPIKIAEQVQDKKAKNHAMRAATSQVKANSNLSFSVAKSEGESHKYHIVISGQRVTTEPVTLEHVNNKYGGVKRLEASGHTLVPAVHEHLSQHPKTGQWSLRRS